MLLFVRFRFDLQPFNLHPKRLEASAQIGKMFSQCVTGSLRLGNHTCLDLALIDPHFHSYRTHFGGRKPQSNHASFGPQVLKRFANTLDQFHA